MQVFKNNNGLRWIVSSRIMHRDIFYALCYDEADAGVIFYHQAVYLKRELGTKGCALSISPWGVPKQTHIQ